MARGASTERMQMWNVLANHRLGKGHGRKKWVMAEEGKGKFSFFFSHTLRGPTSGGGVECLLIC